MRFFLDYRFKVLPFIYILQDALSNRKKLTLQHAIKELLHRKKMPPRSAKVIKYKTLKINNIKKRFLAKTTALNKKLFSIHNTLKRILTNYIQKKEIGWISEIPDIYYSIQQLYTFLFKKNRAILARHLRYLHLHGTKTKINTRALALKKSISHEILLSYCFDLVLEQRTRLIGNVATNYIFYDKYLNGQLLNHIETLCDSKYRDNPYLESFFKYLEWCFVNGISLSIYCC